MKFAYPYSVRPSADGAWQVRFPDVPEALTEGETEAEAHALAQDCLLAALGGLVKLRRDLPKPGRRAAHLLTMPVLQTVKLGLYQAMRDAGLNTVTLAAKLGKAEGEVRRMLDLDHATKIDALERALAVLGQRVTAEVRAAA